MKQIGPYHDASRLGGVWVLRFTSEVSEELYEYAEVKFEPYTNEEIAAVQVRAVKAFDKARRAK